MEAIQNEIPSEMECNILDNIAECNTDKNRTDKEIFIKFLSFILKENTPKPIQAVSVQLGNSAKIDYPLDAFHWGLTLLKECRDSNLYTIVPRRDTALGKEVYIVPRLILTKAVRDRIDKLQYLPPMKKPPIPWKNNYNGGWMWENKHLVLGSHFNQHDKPLAYDVINKLQSIPWEIDPSTYLFEKDTNEQLNRNQFLRVMDEYIDKHFYFVWRYDKRGRSYSSGYDLNLQNNEYGKALLSMHKKEVITQLPFLYISIANLAGKDKLTWQERVNWAANQDINEIKWEKPMLGRKALRAVQDAECQKPSGYTMSLDATSSGIQIMAVISGCQKTAKYVNCIDPNKRYDLYGEVVKMMNKKLKHKVKRLEVKEATMTHFYNSEARPKAVLKKEGQLEAFYEVVNGLLPGAEQVMNTINNCWQSNKDHHSWIMPDGHQVYIPVKVDVKGTYTDPEFGRIRVEWEQIGTSDDYRSLCPNVIHSIDGYIAREMVRRCKFQLVHVHDCFLFHPNHFLAVKDNYRKIMAEIAKSDLFGSILRQIMGSSSLRVKRKNNTLDSFIVNSEYMLS